jgi:hypothetical protein
MRMRTRPVRPNIYLPVVRFGVADSDWFTVLLISCVGYLAPVAFGITVLYVPLQMWTWLLATAGSIAFFNYIRIGRKPYWLQHKFKAMFSHHRQYRSIPNGSARPFRRSWLIETGSSEVSVSPTQQQNQSSLTAFLLEHNHRIQEAKEDECHRLSLATD